jgi:hypothetical protein
VIRTAFITAPRPRPTLAASLGSYRRAGFDGDIIVCSDDLKADMVVADGVYTIRNEVHLGNKLNWDRALSMLVVQSGPDDWLMVCEDDIVWQAGAAEALGRDLEMLVAEKRMMNVGALSLYAPRKHTKDAGPLRDGWHWDKMQHGRKTWGAQCLVFRTAMAVALQEDLSYRSFMLNEKVNKNIDLIIGTVINNAGRNILYRIPCLVDHIGAGNSSLGYAEDRPNLVSDYFRGPRA